jgi:predicted  nucleic acid-binding Zn-ribbon protein
MRNISEFLNECLIVEGDKVAELEKKINKVEKEAEEANKKAEDAEAEAAAAEKEANKAEESIKDEKSFKDYARNKFEEVFGDDLDEDQMNEVVDGILKKYKDDADKGDWGKLVGVLNKSFGA